MKISILTNNIILIISILVSGGIGAYIGLSIAKLKRKGELSTLDERQKQLNQIIEDLKQHSSKIEGERNDIRNEKDQLSSELTKRNTEFEDLQEKIKEQKAEVEKLQEKFSKEFENLANRILDEKSKKFTSQNKD